MYSITSLGKSYIYYCSSCLRADHLMSTMSHHSSSFCFLDMQRAYLAFQLGRQRVLSFGGLAEVESWPSSLDVQLLVSTMDTEALMKRMLALYRRPTSYCLVGSEPDSDHFSFKFDHSVFSGLISDLLFSICKTNREGRAEAFLHGRTS